MPLWAGFERAAGSGSLGLGRVALGRVLGVLWGSLGLGFWPPVPLWVLGARSGAGAGFKIGNRKPNAGGAFGSGSCVLGVPLWGLELCAENVTEGAQVVAAPVAAVNIAATRGILGGVVVVEPL